MISCINNFVTSLSFSGVSIPQCNNELISAKLHKIRVVMAEADINQIKNKVTLFMSFVLVICSMGEKPRRMSDRNKNFGFFSFIFFFLDLYMAVSFSKEHEKGRTRRGMKEKSDGNSAYKTMWHDR